MFLYIIELKIDIILLHLSIQLLVKDIVFFILIGNRYLFKIGVLKLFHIKSLSKHFNIILLLEAKLNLCIFNLHITHLLIFQTFYL